MRLAQNPNDELSLIRVVNVPPRGVGEKTLQLLRTLSKKDSLSPGNLLLQLGRDTEPFKNSFPHRALAILAGFGAMLSRWTSVVTEFPPLYIMDQIINETDYHAFIDEGTEEGNERWENIMELQRLAGEYQDRTITDFLEDVALVSDQDTIENNPNVPTLLTLHAAKGLEFKVVFIAGLNDGTLPHSRSFDDLEAMQEERRLLYVGITRAKDRLYLVYAQNRNAFGYPDPVEPSRFLSDIPDHLVNEISSMRSTGRSRLGNFDPKAIQWGSKRPGYARDLCQKDQPGAHVQHPVWGG